MSEDTICQTAARIKFDQGHLSFIELRYNYAVMSRLKKAIRAQKQALEELAAEPLQKLAEKCAPHWREPEDLDRILQEGIPTLPHCNMIYAVNTDGILISANIGSDRLDTQWRGVDLTGRPYFDNELPAAQRAISNVYTSRLTTLPTLTLMQAVFAGKEYLGFIAADFSVDELPAVIAPQGSSTGHWQQYKGDPAIRGTLFMQERAISAMDLVLDEAMDIITALMQYQGIFHCKIHFSSSRVSLWSVDDPFDYQIHTVDELTDPDVCLAYPKRPLHPRAQVSEEDIAKVIELFKALRKADEIIYLRSASFNLINGMVGLTFSCDGSHYLHYSEFIKKGSDFWFGAQAEMQST